MKKMNAIKKLVLFDFDGVLVRSNHCHIKNIRDAFSEMKAPLVANDADIVKHFGKHYTVIIPELLEKKSRGTEIEWKIGEKMRLGFEKESFSDSFELIDGLPDYLEKLVKKGYGLAIASGNSAYVLERWLSKLQIRKCFGLVIGSDGVKNGKPDPEMILMAAKHFKVALKDIIYVGDTRNDVLMAKNAGCMCAVVLTGVLSRKDADLLDVDIIAEDVTKIGL